MSDSNPDANRRNSIFDAFFRKIDKNKRRAVPSEEFEEDIMTMINEGHELGTIEDDEAKMISNIFALNDKEASDIMTHRSMIIGIEASTPLNEAVDFMLDENNSRFPVYEENIDHIIGIIHLKDACRVNRTATNRELSIKNIPDLLREPVLITETKKIDALFQQMQKQKTQMVIVIDEYGQTAGLVAMEDILEEIVGNIMDEYDEEEEHIEEQDGNQFIIDGMSELSDLEEKFGINFREETFDTLNGFLISQMDKIPEEGDQFSVEVDGYVFEIYQIENRRIDKVLVYKKSAEEEQC